MKKIFTLFILCDLLSVNQSIGQCNQIAMIGEFNGWAGDLDMIRDTINPDLWTLPVVFTVADDLEGDGIIQMKFREHGDWAYAWGNSDFPSGVAIYYGPDLPVPYGAWDVSFNCVSLEYNFQVQIGIDEGPGLNPGFRIWPNPASSCITIDFEHNSTFNSPIISIYNNNGQELIKHQITEPKTLIDVSMLPGGVYFVKLVGEKTIVIEKLVMMD
jgi:hypothetical protein